MRTKSISSTESGLDVNCTSPECETPIAVAAMGGNVSVLRYLLDHGGDPGMPDADGDTPLHGAAGHRGHDEAVRLLLSRGADVDPINNRGLAPLDKAAWKGHDQALKALLEHGADPNRVSHNMFSPLMMACHPEGSLKCIKLLVEAGADVNFKKAGADPNISDGFGENPLMQAARNGRRDLVEIIFPRTKPIASLPNWSVDGIIAIMKYMPFKFKDVDLTKENILAYLKPQGDEAFAKGDYLGATYLYDLAMHIDPLDTTLFSKRSLCWLRLGDGEKALSDAQQCKMMRPCWSKSWYHEGAALSLLKNYRGAADAFVEALKLDPASDEIKAALREAIDALRCNARFGEHNS
ncbi:unnamed protein product [Urochloa humidicola]